MSSERAANLTVTLSQSVQRVKLCNAMKFQQSYDTWTKEEQKLLVQLWEHFERRMISCRLSKPYRFKSIKTFWALRIKSSESAQGTTIRSGFD